MWNEIKLKGTIIYYLFAIILCHDRALLINNIGNAETLSNKGQGRLVTTKNALEVVY